MPAYSWRLTCSSYQGPSRSPDGRPAAASVASTNAPYIVSLSRTAAGGSTSAASSPATVVLPDPGAPATTQASPVSRLWGRTVQGYRREREAIEGDEFAEVAVVRGGVSRGRAVRRTTV